MERPGAGRPFAGPFSEVQLPHSRRRDRRRAGKLAPMNYARLDIWIDRHFDEEVQFLQALVRLPTDTPPGDNAPLAELTARLLGEFDFEVERHPVPQAAVQAHGLKSITNLIVRRRYAATGLVIALNAHGDVVPPGDGWTRDPYGAEIVDGCLYGRAAAVSKSDFATYAFAVRALESLGVPLSGAVELHFTYDEEFGGELGPGWLLEQGLTRPDLLLAAGFSYQIVTAHSGCLQMEVTLTGQAAHAAYPESGVDALEAATVLLTALYAYGEELRRRRSEVAGISHPSLVVGLIEGGSHTNVVPGHVVLKFDRRIIPEEDPAAVEVEVRARIAAALAGRPGIRVAIRRLLLAAPLQPLPGRAPLVAALRRHAREVMGIDIAESGSPLYTDARLYGEHGVAAAIYGAGPRTVLESNAKRADEHLRLDDLRAATKIVARSLLQLLADG